MMNRILFLIMFLMTFAQQSMAAGVDETIEKYFAPFSDALSSIIFTSISFINFIYVDM